MEIEIRKKRKYKRRPLPDIEDVSMKREMLSTRKPKVPKEKKGRVYTRKEKVIKNVKHLLVIPKKKKGKNPNNPMGRPTVYNDVVAGIIIMEIMKGRTLTQICNTDDRLPCITTVYGWLNNKSPNYNEEFLKSYQQARKIQADTLVDQTLDIADDGRNDFIRRVNQKTGKVEVVVDHDHISRSRLRVETRQKFASKLNPTKYGDKVEVTGKDGEGIIPKQVNLNINFIKPKDKEEK